MAAYSSLSTSESSHTNGAVSQGTSSRIRMYRRMWILQGVLAVPRIFFSAIVAVMLLFLFLFLPVFVFIIWIVLAIDIFLASKIVITVVKQYKEKEHDTLITLKREAKKTAFATYLWLWTLFTKPSIFFKAEAETKRTSGNTTFRIGSLVYMLLVIMSFYPMLWFAYQDWKAERDSEQRGDIELGPGDEHRTHLIPRDSIDDLGDLVERDIDPKQGK